MALRHVIGPSVCKHASKACDRDDDKERRPIRKRGCIKPGAIRSLTSPQNKKRLRKGQRKRQSRVDSAHNHIGASLRRGGCLEKGSPAHRVCMWPGVCVDATVLQCSCCCCSRRHSPEMLAHSMVALWHQEWGCGAVGMAAPDRGSFLMDEASHRRELTCGRLAQGFEL
ncbi:hypothetical protein AOLI_G00157680 [Acnodon oligacanthus]